MKETTFTPLKRGRFRCNQTRVVLTRKQTNAYRKSRDNEGRVMPREEDQFHGNHRKREMPEAKMYVWIARTRVKCPHCGESFVCNEAGVKSCIDCGGHFKAVRS